MKKWIDRMQSDPMTASFLNDNITFVENKAHSILSNMVSWISNDISKEELGVICLNEGKEMFHREIPLCEVVRAMYVGRRTLLQFVESETVIESALQIHQMRELDERVTLFFDRAQYFMIRGYNDEMQNRFSELISNCTENRDSVLFDKLFYN